MKDQYRLHLEELADELVSEERYGVPKQARVIDINHIRSLGRVPGCVYVKQVPTQEPHEGQLDSPGGPEFPGAA